MVLAVALVYLYDHTIGQVVNRVTSTVRVGVFVGAWTAATALLGTRGVSKGVSALRQRTKGLDSELATLPKEGGKS